MVLVLHALRSLPEIFECTGKNVLISNILVFGDPLLVQELLWWQPKMTDPKCDYIPRLQINKRGTHKWRKSSNEESNLRQGDEKQKNVSYGSDLDKDDSMDPIGYNEESKIWWRRMFSFFATSWIILLLTLNTAWWSYKWWI